MKKRAAAVVLAGFALLWLVTVQADLGDLAGDSAAYIALARALVTGQGYHSLYLAGHPLHTLYPFLFPCVLAPVVAVAGLNAWWLHVWMVLLAVLALVLVWRRLRERAGATTALLVIVLTGSGLLWWDGVSRIMSDVLFTGLIASVCGYVEQYRRSPAASPRDWWPVFLGLTVVFYLRTVGAALGLAALWVLARDGRHRPLGWRRRTLGLGASWALACLAWFAYTGWSEGGASYLMQWRFAEPMGAFAAAVHPSSLVARCALHLLYYTAEIARLAFPPHEWISAQPALTAWLIWPVLLSGWRRQRHDRPVLEETFALLYAAVLLLWPYCDGRLLLPLVPWLWWYLLAGLRALLPDGAARRLRAYAVCVAALLILHGVTMGWRVRQHLLGNLLSADQRQYIEANRWLGAHAPPGSIVMSSKPSVTWWYSRRAAVAYPPVHAGESPEAVRAAVAARGAAYLLVDGFSAAVNTVVVPALLADPAGLRLAAAFGRSAILRRMDRPSSGVRAPGPS